ncbi:SlyX family protein [Cerasicoccus arenae]|nr:SlyX family protein [Cerasicoccus arenae]MBK1859524.1 SlyX family protein [Cerasicoccus arenae]
MILTEPTYFNLSFSIVRPTLAIVESDDQQDAIIRLESRLTYLERHIEEQDREIYRQSEQLLKLTRESENLRNRLQSMADAKDMPSDERPPHY